MLFVGSRPVIYFSFDNNAGLNLHGAAGAGNDEDVSKAFILPYPFWNKNTFLFIESFSFRI